MQEELPCGKGKDKRGCCLQLQEHPQLLQQQLRSVGICLSSSFKVVLSRNAIVVLVKGICV